MFSFSRGCTVDDTKNAIDFWMSDRAGDCTTFLKSLNVEDEKVLKCCAHMILCADHAIEKTFKQLEQKIGVHKLLDTSAGDRAFTGGSSVHTLGLIAISKLLSPSHASHSVSLYNEFKQWLENNNEDPDKLTGFVAHRFGRIAELSREYISHKSQITKFFDDVVDENSNKLVLAVSIYIQNEWFFECTKLYAKPGDLIIFPLMDLYGIDRHTRHEGDDSKCDWFSVRQFFQMKMPEIKMKQEILSASTDSFNQLYSKALAEVIEALNRQISEVPFLTKECVSEEDVKLAFAPISNLGCESEIGWLDNRLNISGGTTSISTLSNKNVVTTNK